MAKKTVTKKKTARKPKKAPARAVPPPDNPQLRHEEMNIDRLVSPDEGMTVAAARDVLAVSPARGRRADRKAAGVRGEGLMKRTAAYRLAALEESRGLAHADAGAPVGLVAPASAVAPEGGEMVPPAPGISNWVQLGPTAIPNGQTYSAARVLVTGRVTAIVLDPTNPQTLYVGSAQGGVWKSTDGGRRWVATSDNEASLAIGALAMDPSNPQVLYAGTGEGNFSGDSYYGSGVLKTVNGGASWVNLNPGSLFTGSRFGRIAVTPGTPLRLFAATSGGVYRSQDGGADWAQLAGGLPGGAATDLVIDAATPTTVYAAFWSQGIYRTTNAAAANPAWTKLAGGLPAGGFTRIALGISASSPQTLYALIADSGYTVNGFYQTTNGGTSWTAIALPGGNIGGQGFYNLNVAVDPTTPDIVYLSGISVWKATRNSTTGAWTIANVGATIHPDNHAFAIQANNHQVVYAGSDGGIYKSADGGLTWSDAINSGLCITQFEFMGQHPTSDAVVFCGTQDNGTEQFRNSPVFNHADDGDGGCTAVDQVQPANVLSTYYGPSPKRSTQAGKFGTWFSVAGGLAGSGLFYPPMTLDETNPNNIAFGTDQVNLDAAQGTGGWPTKAALPGVTGNVSALHYVNSGLLYAATTTGEVYRLTKSGANWTAAAIHAAPLPGNWIWDVCARPDNQNIVIVVMSGFGIAHVWRGVVPAGGGPATWTNVSGGGAGTTLPDIPVNALAIDPAAPNTYYIGTDVAVYRTTNGGNTWTQFSQGLPNCALFDLKLHAPARLLRAATHGRGMWERRLDVPAMPDVDLFVRDHVLDTGRTSPSPANVVAAFEDPLQFVALGDVLNWWMCADIKVDALEGAPPAYQLNVADVDYVAFESRLAHRNAQRGNVNRLYVQVHNRGIQAGAAVTVKLLAADATAGLPALPPDFWTAFPGNSIDTTHWKPIGAAKTIAQLSPTEPAVLEWDWSTPADAADHSCLLAVIDSPSNPIPPGNKIFNVDQLVRIEKHVGLKNLHVVNAPPGAVPGPPFSFFSRTEKPQTIKVVNGTAGKWTLGLLFPKSVKEPTLTGVARKKPTQAMLAALKARVGKQIDSLDTTWLFVIDDIKKGAMFADMKVPKAGLRALMLLAPPATAASDGQVAVVQEEGGTIVGGSTFVLRTTKIP